MDAPDREMRGAFRVGLGFSCRRHLRINGLFDGPIVMNWSTRTCCCRPSPLNQWGEVAAILSAGIGKLAPSPGNQPIGSGNYLITVPRRSADKLKGKSTVSQSWSNHHRSGADRKRKCLVTGPIDLFYRTARILRELSKAVMLGLRIHSQQFKRTPTKTTDFQSLRR